MRDFLKSMFIWNIVMNPVLKAIKIFKPQFPNISRYNLVTVLETERDYSFSLQSQQFGGSSITNNKNRNPE